MMSIIHRLLFYIKTITFYKKEVKSLDECGGIIVQWLCVRWMRMRRFEGGESVIKQVRRGLMNDKKVMKSFWRLKIEKNNMF